MTLAALALMLLVAAAPAATPAGSEPAPGKDSTATLLAENQLLRQTVARQRETIRELEAKPAQLQRSLDDLRQRLREAGVKDEPAAAPTAPPVPTQPAGEPDSKEAGGGVQKKADRVVWVLDGSGSMINTFGPLKDEVLKAAASMQPKQLLNVIVSFDERELSFQKALVPATPANLQKLRAFLDSINVTGTTNLLVGVEAALRQRPDVIWLTTDGDLPDNRAFIEGVRRLNRGTCRINTVLAAAPSDVTRTFTDMMWRVASESGGACYDAKGKPVPKPPEPPTRRTPPAPPKDRPLPTGPSIFKE
jgi:hypothetical protein